MDPLIPASLMLPPVNQALDEILRRYGVSRKALLARNKARNVVNARRTVAVELRARGYTLADIGDALGLHHTTVMNLLNPKGGDRARR